MTAIWVFHENYPGVGAALVDGPAIVAIKDAREWLNGKF